MPDQVPDTTMRTGTGNAIQGLSHIITDTVAQATMTPIEAALDQNIGIIAIITGLVHDAPIPYTAVIAINLTIILHTHHIADYSHTQAHHTTSGLEACCIHIHPTYLHDRIDMSHSDSSRS